VYALYAQWQVVYVGQAYAGGIGERLKRHRGDSLADRWGRFSWFGMRQVLANGALKPLKQVKTGSVETALNQLEALLIDVAEPRLNGQGGTWNKESGVELYVQEILPRSDRDEERTATNGAN